MAMYDKNNFAQDLQIEHIVKVDFATGVPIEPPLLHQNAYTSGFQQQQHQQYHQQYHQQQQQLQQPLWNVSPRTSIQSAPPAATGSFLPVGFGFAEITGREILFPPDLSGNYIFDEQFPYKNLPYGQFSSHPPPIHTKIMALVGLAPALSQKIRSKDFVNVVVCGRKAVFPASTVQGGHYPAPAFQVVKERLWIKVASITSYGQICGIAIEDCNEFPIKKYSDDKESGNRVFYSFPSTCVIGVRHMHAKNGGNWPDP